MLLSSAPVLAQGPPITVDKPIMLGADAFIIKTLTEVRRAESGTFVKAPVMLHYLPTSNTLVAAHFPYVYYDFEGGESGQVFGDMGLLAKYQFYRRDGMGKTFRMVAKTYQTLPTGKPLAIDDMSLGRYQSYQGIIAGYESIRYGILGEVGYLIDPNGNLDEWRQQLGFGLPLLKPTYPVKQLNLYFEYRSSWFTELDAYALFYAQGIQYAVGRVTVETSLQLPLTNNVPEAQQRRYSLFMGARYTF